MLALGDLLAGDSSSEPLDWMVGPPQRIRRLGGVPTGRQIQAISLGGRQEGTGRKDCQLTGKQSLCLEEAKEAGGKSGIAKASPRSHLTLFNLWKMLYNLCHFANKVTHLII